MYIPPNLIEPLLIRKPASVLTYPVAIWNDRSRLPVGYAAIAGMCCVSFCLCGMLLREINPFNSRRSQLSRPACRKPGGSDGLRGRSPLGAEISASRWASSLWQLCICHVDCLRRGSLGGDVEDSCSNGSRCTSRYYKVVFSNYRTVQRGFHCIILYSTIQHSIVVGASTHTSNSATAILGPVPCQTCWKGRVRQACRSSKNCASSREFTEQTHLRSADCIVATGNADPNTWNDHG